MATLSSPVRIGSSEPRPRRTGLIGIAALTAAMAKFAPTIAPAEPESTRSGLIQLTGPQKNELISLVESPALSPDFARTGDVNPNARVFSAHFDGTWNDVDNVPPGESETLVAKMFKATAASANSVVESHYLHGVGTRCSSVDVYTEGATGYGCEERAETMYHQLLASTAKWRAENPKAQIHVHAVGFSRGAATALHFLNLVDTRGLLGDLKPFSNRSKGLNPGEVMSSAVLFDVVATGQTAVLDLSVPPTTQSVLHLTAGGEERSLFKLTTLSDLRYDNKGRPVITNQEWAEARGVSAPPGIAYKHLGTNDDGRFVYQRIQQINVPAARHSDIGGAYVEGGIAHVPEFLARTFQASLGIPCEAPLRPMVKEILAAEAHDSRDSYEKGRQSVQRILGANVDQQNVKRQLADTQDREWNGDLLRTVRLSLRDATGEEVDTALFKVVIPHDEGAPFPTLPRRNSPQRVEFRPDDIRAADTDALSQAGKAFTLAPDAQNRFGGVPRLMLKGVPVDDLESPASLFRKATQTMNDACLVIEAEDERLYCPLQEGRQVVAPGSQLQLHVQEEMWPKAIVDAVKSINARTHANSPGHGNPGRFSQREVNYRMWVVSEGVAKTLAAEFPFVTGLNVKIADGTTNARSARRKVAVAPIWDKFAPSATQAEVALLGNRVRQLEEAMGCVVDMYQAVRMNPGGFEAKIALEPKAAIAEDLEANTNVVSIQKSKKTLAPR